MANLAASGATAAASNAMMATSVISAASSSLGDRRSRYGKGNVAQADGLRRQALSNSLQPLQIGKKSDAYVHVQYTFNPVDALEPITLTVSTPMPRKPTSDFGSDFTSGKKPTSDLSSDFSSGKPTSDPSSDSSSGAISISSSEDSHLGISKKQADEIVRDLGRFFRLPSPDSKDVTIHVDVKRHPYADLQVGERWQEIQGQEDWKGLMGSETEDMDPVFRGEIVRYGEFAQATYDAFDHDEDSKHCGDSKFDKASLLEEVGLKERGYEITDYIYATAEAHLMPHFFRRHGDQDMAWSKDSNFMGFVAVCTSPEEIERLGRRDVVVAWRGTVTNLEWVENVQDYFSPAGFDRRTVPSPGSPVMVESGFLSVYKSKNENSRYNKLSARSQVHEALKRIVDGYQDEELSITVTGHSLGSALAMLCAYDIAESGINKRDRSKGDGPGSDTTHLDALEEELKQPEQLLMRRLEEEAVKISASEVMYVDEARVIRANSPRPGAKKSEDLSSKDEALDANLIPVSVFSFAGPRLGNSAFKNRVERLGVKILRVVNVHDIVPQVPGVVFNEKLAFLHKLAQFLPSSYVHVGQVLELDTNDSQYLKKTGMFLDKDDLVNAHNMEAYLHMVDGYHEGPEERFSPAVKRDLALVNKASDFLESRFGVPNSWWAEKKMVMDPETGHYVVRGDEVQE